MGARGAPGAAKQLLSPHEQRAELAAVLEAERLRYTTHFGFAAFT